MTAETETLQHVIRDIADLSTQALVKRATHRDQSRHIIDRNPTIDPPEVPNSAIPAHDDPWYDPCLGAWVTTNLEIPA